MTIRLTNREFPAILCLRLSRQYYTSRIDPPIPLRTNKGLPPRGASEYKPDRGLVSAWCHEVRAAECGQEVIQRHFVTKVRDGESQGRPVALRVKQIVRASANVEHMTRGDTRRIMVVVLGSFFGYHQSGGAVV